MPSDLSLRLSESNSNKRKAKNKMPKRLRRKNKHNDVNHDSNPLKGDYIMSKIISESFPIQNIHHRLSKQQLFKKVHLSL